MYRVKRRRHGPLTRKNDPPHNPVEIRGGLAHLLWCDRRLAGLRRIDPLIQAIVAEAASWPLHPVPGSAGPEADTLVRTVLTCLEDSKAEDIVAIALHGKTILADVMIIAIGRSNIHVGAIAERIIGAFKGERHKPPRRNCFFSCPSWNLLGLPRYLKNLFLLIRWNFGVAVSRPARILFGIRS
jgi:ribosome-associated protein